MLSKSNKKTAKFEHDKIFKQVKENFKKLGAHLIEHDKKYQTNPNWAFDELFSINNSLKACNEIFEGE